MWCRHPALRRLLGCLETLAPLELADSSWDNVGLLFEVPYLEGRRDYQAPSYPILVTNDLTGPVLREAIEKGVFAIISYHPPWFKASKRISLDNHHLSLLAVCGAAGISVYSPHTALDAVDGGMRVAFAPGADRQSLIDSLAVCAGSGGSLFGEIDGPLPSLLLTGEMSHHQVLAAQAGGSTVILTEHSNCERPYLREIFTPKLSDALPPEFSVFYSNEDRRDPLEIVTISA